MNASSPTFANHLREHTGPAGGVEAVPAPATHLHRIDVLRAAAILLVFAYHALPNVTKAFGFAWNGAWLNLQGRNSLWLWIFYPAHLGWAGVSFFFVISGFCIHYSFLKHPASESHAEFWPFVRKFLWKRFWRIYPMYLAVLLAFSALAIRHDVPVGATNFWLHAFLGHNWLSATHFAIVPAFWSLAVEWQFYLLYPALLWLRRQLGIAGVLWVAASFSVAARLLASLLQNWSEEINHVLWYSPIVLLFDWTLGAVLAEKFIAGQQRLPLTRLVPVFASLFIVSTLYRPTQVCSFTLASLMFAGITGSYISRTKPLARWERLLLPLGMCSYSFYLWHQPLIGWLLHYIHRAGIPDTPATNCASLLLIVLPLIALGSWCSYKWIELPSIAFGRSAKIVRSLLYRRRMGQPSRDRC